MQETTNGHLPFWRRIEPFSAFVVFCCVAWTLPVFFGAWGPRYPGLTRAGAVVKALLWEGEYWRLVSATFLHADWVHLSLNGISLYLVGSALVRGIGARFLFGVLILSAMGGHAASLALTDPGDLATPRMGISGAVFGVLGAFLGAEWWLRRGDPKYLKSPIVRVVLFFLGLNVALGLFFPQIDQWAHIGGLIAGLIYALLYFWKRGRYPVRAGVLTALLAGLPLAYLCAPVLSPTFHLYMAAIADQKNDKEAAVAAYSSVIGLEPDHARARIRLAVLENDPTHLDHIEDPFGDVRTRAAYVAAIRTLLVSRAITDSEEAGALLLQVQRLRGGQAWMVQLWRTLASGLVEAGELRKAEAALENALAIQDDPHAANQLIGVLIQRLKSDRINDDARHRLAVRIAQLGRIAVGVIEDKNLVRTAEDREPHVQRFVELVRILTDELNSLRADPSRRDDLHSLAGAIADFYRKFGMMLEGGAIESIPPHARAPSAFYLAVRFRLLSIGEGAERPDDLVPLLKGAINLARELENTRLAEDMEQFGRESGLLSD
ncbi:MAG: rhomboid family intramembrane serine protease [Planctomycetota bacterium]